MVFKKSGLLLSLFVLMTSLAFAEGNRGYEIKEGRVYFEDNKVLDENINLSGEWEFYLGRNPAEVSLFVNAGIAPEDILTVPGTWNESIRNLTGSNDPINTGCYRIVVPNLDPETQYGFLIKEAPNTSCAVFVNGELQTTVGDPFGVKKEGFFTSHSSYEPVLGSFYPDHNGEAEIIIYVNNYFYRKGGLTDTPVIGPKKSIFRMNNMMSAFNISVSGLLLFIGFLNIIQFCFNRKRKEYFYLGLVSLSFAIRVASAGYSAVSVLFPSLPGEIKRNLEYFAIWAVPPALIQLTRIIYPYKRSYFIIPGVKEIVVRRILCLICVVTGVLSLVLPSRIGNRLVPLMEFNVMVIILILFVMILFAMIRKERHVGFYLSSLLVIAVGFVFDVIFTRYTGILPISFMPFFLVLFSLLQVGLLARMQNELYSDSIHGTGGLKKLNEGYVRFVPREFIRLLENESLSSVRLGDCAARQMSIAFSKIVVKRIPEGNEAPAPVLPEEEFKIFNEYIEMINPIVSKHNGFIYKFTNGGFFTLYPESSNDAILAGIEIGERTRKLTEGYKGLGFTVSIKSGYHYGRMLLGTVGEEECFDNAVISEAVNEVARIQSVCEKNDKTNVVSEEFKENLILSKLKGVYFSELATVQVKGKSDLMQIYDCMFINGGDLKL